MCYRNRLHRLICLTLAALYAAASFGGHSPIARRPAGTRLAQGAAPIDGQVAGAQWFGAPGIQITTGELMALEAMAAGRLRAPATAAQPERVPSRRSLPQDPNAPLVAQWPWPPSSEDLSRLRAAPSRLPQTLATSFTGATFSDSGAFPPDSMGAVGPSQFLVGINGRVRTFSKAGTADGVLEDRKSVV